MANKFLGASVIALTCFVAPLITIPTFGSSNANAGTSVYLKVGETENVYVTTEEKDVEGLLNDAGVEVKETDALNVKLTDNIKANMLVEIQPSINIVLNVDGEDEELTVKYDTTVKDLIKKKNEETGLDYYYFGGDVTDRVVKDTKIALKSRTESSVTEKIEVPHTTTYIDSYELNEGVEIVKVEGKNGLRSVTTRTIFIGGEEYLNEISEDIVEIEVVNKVIERGVAKTVSTGAGNLKYSVMYTMSASAYTAGPESTGKRPGDKGYGLTASGMRAQHGVVAVDPKVIPLGTKLYIEGYGMAVAGDTGGAIKGHKIDLFYDSLSAALQFGRRNVKVYVLN